MNPRKSVPLPPVEDEPADHEWAEYNLPFALLACMPEEEDRFAFVGLSTALDADPSDGTG